jgi:hypothetical protein
MQNGKNIYREVAKNAKDVRNKADFTQGILRDFCVLAVPWFSSVLSVMGEAT